MKDIVRRFISAFTKYILRRINTINGYGYIPELKWKDIKAEDPNEKVKRIIDCVSARILTANEVRDFIINLEGI